MKPIPSYTEAAFHGGVPSTSSLSPTFTNGKADETSSQHPRNSLMFVKITVGVMKVIWL